MPHESTPHPSERLDELLYERTRELREENQRLREMLRQETELRHELEEEIARLREPVRTVKDDPPREETAPGADSATDPWEVERAAELVAMTEGGMGGHRGMDPTLRDMLRNYIAGLDTAVQELRSARVSQDRKAAASVVSRIKGGAASYGLIGLHQAAVLAEHALNEDTDPFPNDQLDSLLRALTSVSGE